MQQPPHGYGPPSQGHPPSGYGPPGYPPPGYPPPKKGMSGGMIAVLVVCGLFGSCVVLGAIGGKSKDKDKDESAAAASAAPDPSAVAAKLAEQQRAAEEAKVAKEKSAVETFPAKKTEIGASLKKASSAADQAKWSQADAELSTADAALATFRGTSIAESKEFLDLDAKAEGLRKKIAPQLEKIAKAAAAASAEAELKASAISVSSQQLFNAYQANEIAADEQFKGKPLLVTGTVDSIDKGPFGGFYLRLATSNPFMSTMCDMENSEKQDLMNLSKGERTRVLCKGGGMTMGSPSLRDCVFR